MIKWVYGFIGLLMLVLVGGCTGQPGTGSEIVLDGSNDGETITLDAGQELVIHLEANPSTGYGWQVVDAGDGVLEQVGEAEFTPSARGRRVVGAGGTETLRFKAAQAGTTTLELVYRQPWEGGAQSDETFQVSVTVR